MAGMEAELLFCHVRRLIVRVLIGASKHVVEYDGRGFCREKILVDGEVVASRFTLNRLSARLEFKIGDSQAAFEGKFVFFAQAPFWDICRLTIDDELVFDEQRLDADIQDDSASEGGTK
jgi:hypothetical protein